MRPVLLLVAGMMNDASVWDGVVAELHDHADVRIALPVQASIAEMAAAAWTQLDGVPATTPVVLAGFSLGGYVAIEMLVRPRRALQAAALICTSARPESPEAAAMRAKTIAAMQRDHDRMVDAAVPWNTHEAPPALAARIGAMMRGVGAETAIRQSRAVMGRADHRAALARLDLPLVVLAARQDRVVPPERARELAELVPAAQFEIVDGAGHMLPCEQPHAVARALRRLLR
jgi:pimeloyl-ACP methyl ester carboxylesterase